MIDVVRRIAKRIARPRAHRLRAQRVLRAAPRPAARAPPHDRRPVRRVGARRQGRRALRQVGRARALPRRFARAGRLAVLPGTGLHVPGTARQRAADARAARLDPRARRLRLDRRVGDRGVRPDLTRQRRSRRRSRCWPWCSACSRRATSTAPRRGSSGTTAGTSRATSTGWRRGSADAMYRGAMLATHLNETGRHDETDLLATDWFAHADRPLPERARRLRPPAALRQGGRGRFADAVGARRHLAVPVRARARGRRRRRTDAYESYGAKPT